MTNFDWITAQLAVGGRVAAEHLPHLARAHGIGAVVDLRDEECDDALLLQQQGIGFLHLPTPDMCGVECAQLERGVRFVHEQMACGERVLIHCEHGIGRSATLALCVMVYQGAAPLDALEHMKARRALISPSPAQFDCWKQWLDRHRASRGIHAWELPDADEFGRIAYRHLGRT